MDMIATTFDIACSFRGMETAFRDRTVTTKELQWSATSAERRKFERDFQAELEGMGGISAGALIHSGAGASGSASARSTRITLSCGRMRTRVEDSRLSSRTVTIQVPGPRSGIR